MISAAEILLSPYSIQRLLVLLVSLKRQQPWKPLSSLRLYWTGEEGRMICWVMTTTSCCRKGFFHGGRIYLYNKLHVLSEARQVGDSHSSFFCVLHWLLRTSRMVWSSCSLSTMLKKLVQVNPSEVNWVSDIYVLWVMPDEINYLLFERRILISVEFGQTALDWWLRGISVMSRRISWLNTENKF